MYDIVLQLTRLQLDSLLCVDNDCLCNGGCENHGNAFYNFTVTLPLILLLKAHLV